MNNWKFNSQLGDWEDAVAEVNKIGSEIIVLSAETFSGHHSRPETIRDIQRFCEMINAEPMIIGYARPQYSYMDSLYAQNASTGYETLKFPAYVLRSLSNAVFDLERTFGRWFDTFANVTVKEYRQHKDSPLVRQFLDDIGLNDIQIPGDLPSLNTRNSAKTVEFVRAATEIAAQMPAMNMSMRHRLAAEVRKQCERAFPKDPAFSGFDKATALTVDAHFRQSNQKFAETRMGIEYPFTDSPEDRSYSPILLT